jgi:hypothetical protein
MMMIIIIMECVSRVDYSSVLPNAGVVYEHEQSNNHTNTYRIPRVFLKGHGETIGGIDISLVDSTQEDSHDALACPSRDAMVMIGGRKQHEGMNRYIRDLGQTSRSCSTSYSSRSRLQGGLIGCRHSERVWTVLSCCCCCKEYSKARRQF